MTGTPVTEPLLELTTLVELCRYRAAQRPERRAFVFLDNGVDQTEALTLRELDVRARAIAARLREHAPAGARALLSYPPGLEFVSAFFGCLYAGVVAVPVPPVVRATHDVRYSRLQAVGHSCQPELLLSNARTLDRVGPVDSLFPASPWRLTAVATDEIGDAEADRWSPPAIDPTTVAYLQYTSGTSGPPRGVVLTHGNVMHNLALIVENGAREEDDRDRVPPMVSWLPVFHDMGLITNVIQPVFVGYEAVLMPPAVFARHPFSWLKAISDRGVANSAAPSFGYELCLSRVSGAQRRSLDLSGWRIALIANEPMRAETIDGFSAAFAGCGFRREAFFPSYGMAEATVMVSGGPAAGDPVIREFDAAALATGTVRPAGRGAATRRMVGCGQLQPSMTAAVLDRETGLPCGPDQVGEILISGPSIGRQYWNAPADTARLLRATVPGHGDREFFRTGDLGFVHDGYLFLTCRADDLIVLDGRHHYPYDIEETASGSHVAVRDGFCCAFSVPGGEDAHLVVLAEIATRYRLPGGDTAPQSEDAGQAGRPVVSERDVRRAVRAAVTARHGVPVHEVVLLKAGALPFTTSGKLQRPECRSRYLAGEFTGAGETAATPRLRPA